MFSTAKWSHFRVSFTHPNFRPPLNSKNLTACLEVLKRAVGKRLRMNRLLGQEHLAVVNTCQINVFVKKKEVGTIKSVSVGNICNKSRWERIFGRRCARRV